MVSNASDDLPEPDSPVMTTSRSRGISRLMFLRLCSRAPRISSVVRKPPLALPPFFDVAGNVFARRVSVASAMVFAVSVVIERQFVHRHRTALGQANGRGELL